MKSDPVQNVLNRLEGIKRTGPDQWQACCPVHDDARASLSIGRGDEGVWVLHCHAGCETVDVLKKLGLTMADLYPSKAAAPHGVPKPPTPKPPRAVPPPPISTWLKQRVIGEGTGKKIAGTYPYHSAGGELLYEVVRYEPKDFRQRRPDGKGGWTWNLNDTPRVLYRLPELIAADKNSWVFVVEGEKDADNLAALGLVATTNTGGAGKWGKLASDSPLNGRRVTILADKDSPGRKHAQDVARRLYGRASEVRIVELPGDGKDVSDWIESQGKQPVEEMQAALLKIVSAAPAYAPPAVESSSSRTPQPVLVRVADVQPETLQWFWPGRIPLGKLTVIMGDPGLGKSFLTMDLAARTSRGEPWPDSPNVQNPAGAVVILNAEDDTADTIRPRLEGAGADLSAIHVLQAVREYDGVGSEGKPRMVSLDRDISALEAAISQVGNVRLVIVDPITAYLGRTDSHVTAEVRGLLAPLSEIAGRYKTAILAITHLNKSGGGSALYRATGSLAFVAAARAAFLVAKDKEDPERRLFLPAKNNLAKGTSGMAYSIHDSPTRPSIGVVVWEPSPVPMSADEALADAPAGDREEQSEREQAAVWLRSFLSQGPMKVQDIRRESQSAGFSWPTVKRAKKAADVEPYHEGFQTPWSWRLRQHSGSETL